MTLVSIVDSGAFPCNESAPCSFLHLREGGEKAWMCEHAALCPLFLLGTECWCVLCDSIGKSYSARISTVCVTLDLPSQALGLSFLPFQDGECSYYIVTSVSTGYTWFWSVCGKWHPNERDRVSNVRPWNHYQKSSWRRRYLWVLKFSVSREEGIENGYENVARKWWDFSKRLLKISVFVEYECSVKNILYISPSVFTCISRVRSIYV